MELFWKVTQLGEILENSDMCIIKLKMWKYDVVVKYLSHKLFQVHKPTSKLGYLS